MSEGLRLLFRSLAPTPWLSLKLIEWRSIIIGVGFPLGLLVSSCTPIDDAIATANSI